MVEALLNAEVDTMTNIAYPEDILELDFEPASIMMDYCFNLGKAMYCAEPGALQWCNKLV